MLRKDVSREVINPDYDCSYKLAKYTTWEKNPVPNWHLHPEYELVYVENGNGFMHIGNYRSSYSNGTLIMLGPNIPHTNFGNADGNVEFVAQFDPATFGTHLWMLPEMIGIRQLMEYAKQGILFSKSVHHLVGNKLRDMFEADPLRRMTGLLEILNTLAKDDELTLLKTGSISIRERDYGRINTIYTYVNDHYADKIDLTKVASLVNMTVPAFCRFFKRRTGKTFVHFLCEHRISLACQILTERKHSVFEVAVSTGFGDISNFNRQFKKLMHCTPTAYQRSFERYKFTSASSFQKPVRPDGPNEALF